MQGLIIKRKICLSTVSFASKWFKLSQRNFDTKPENSKDEHLTNTSFHKIHVHFSPYYIQSLIFSLTSTPCIFLHKIINKITYLWFLLSMIFSLSNRKINIFIVFCELHSFHNLENFAEYYCVLQSSKSPCPKSRIIFPIVITCLYSIGRDPPS